VSGPRIAPDLLALVGRLIEAAPAGRPARIAIVGAQGSGKTTLARAAAHAFNAAQISIDDVYLTRAEREAMARDVHPLFLMRGPPGTHDLGLLRRVMGQLERAGPNDIVLLPDFDKRGDDRKPRTEWRKFRGRPSAILVDAWCLGALPQSFDELAEPINTLEAERDPDGRWRRKVNGFLAEGAEFAEGFDAILFLQAPSFDVVLDWRCQQEADLLGIDPADLPAGERARLADFIQYFERITRHMLAGGVTADVTVKLDRNRVPGPISA
jgi:D-glycerate 3-kinase